MKTTIRGAGRASDLALMGDWTRLGYIVTTPDKANVPESFREYSPDYVAIKDNDKVAVAIKTKDDQKDGDKWVQLSLAIENEPGWRFELWMPRWDPDSHPYDGFTPLSKKEIQIRLQVADELIAKNCLDAALLTLLMALEAAARFNFSLDGEPVADARVLSLFSRLYNEGFVDPSEYQQLLQANTFRSTILHGYQNTEIEASLLPLMKHLTERLIKIN